MQQQQQRWCTSSAQPAATHQPQQRAPSPSSSWSWHAHFREHNEDARRKDGRSPVQPKNATTKPHTSSSVCNCNSNSTTNDDEDGHNDDHETKKRTRKKLNYVWRVSGGVLMLMLMVVLELVLLAVVGGAVLHREFLFPLSYTQSPQRTRRAPCAFIYTCLHTRAALYIVYVCIVYIHKART